MKLKFIIPILAVALSACGGNQATPPPTISIADVQTMAVSTFAYGLTQTAEAMPTDTPTNTPAPTNTVLVFNTFAPLNGSGTPLAVSISPTASCYGLLFINDISIPDDTKMAPGQTFTKTWLVQNTGGCNWESGFKWTLISGNPMGGSTVTLSQTVAPGAQFQISVPMIAPNSSGESVGTWRMSDANGNFFGQSVWVKIMVGGASTTPSVTSTPTP
jgi:hypothetical protein